MIYISNRVPFLTKKLKSQEKRNLIDARESIISMLAEGQQKITMKKGLFLLKLDFLEERYEKFVLF